MIQPLKLVESCQHYKVKSIIPVQLQNSSSLAISSCFLSHPPLTPSLPLPSITVNQRESGVCSCSNTHRKKDRQTYIYSGQDIILCPKVQFGNICQLYTVMVCCIQLSSLICIVNKNCKIAKAKCINITLSCLYQNTLLFIKSWTIYDNNITHLL